VQHSVQVGHENIGWHSHSVHISKFPHGQPKVINRAKRFQFESCSSSSSSMTKALLCDTCNQAIADIVGGNLSTSRWRDFEPSPPRVAFRLGDNFKLVRNNLSKACALCSEAYRWMSSSWFDNSHFEPLESPRSIPYFYTYSTEAARAFLEICGIPAAESASSEKKSGRGMAFEFYRCGTHCDKPEIQQ
jgi:hypothetical protein